MDCRVRRAPLPFARQFSKSMAAIAANDIGNLALAVHAREALVVMGMARKYRVRPMPALSHAASIYLSMSVLQPCMLPAV